MTNKERIKLFNEFERLLIKMIISYLKFDHFEDYKVRFDTGGEVKEIYEISIKQVQDYGDMRGEK